MVWTMLSKMRREESLSENILPRSIWAPARHITHLLLIFSCSWAWCSVVSSVTLSTVCPGVRAVCAPGCCQLISNVSTRGLPGPPLPSAGSGAAWPWMVRILRSVRFSGSGSDYGREDPAFLAINLTQLHWLPLHCGTVRRSWYLAIGTDWSHILLGKIFGKITL